MASSMIDVEIIEHLESFSTVPSESTTSQDLQIFLHCLIRGADDGVKPGVERSVTPGIANPRKRAESAKAADSGSISKRRE